MKTETIAVTDRLIIAKISTNDAAFIKELVNTPSWLKFIGDRHIRTIEDATTYIENNHLKSYEDFGFGFYKVMRKSDPEIAIGTCGLAKRPQLEDIDIGFGFLPDHEGKGYGLEASKAIISLAREQFKIKKICAICTANNELSIRLLEKLGMHFEKKVIPFENDEELLLYVANLESLS